MYDETTHRIAYLRAEGNSRRRISELLGVTPEEVRAVPNSLVREYLDQARYDKVISDSLGEVKKAVALFGPVTSAKVAEYILAL